MIKRFLALLTVFTAATALMWISSCTKHKVELPAIKKADPVSQSFCDSVGSTYSGTSKPIVQSKCANSTACHVAGGSAPGDFNSYAVVKAYIDNGTFQSRTFEFMEMPPGAPLDSVTINKLKCWIAAGAKND